MVNSQVNTTLLRLFQANVGSLQSQRSYHSSRHDMWFAWVCACVCDCVWDIVHIPGQPAQSLTYSISDTRIRKLTGRPKAYFTFKTVSQICKTKNQYACNFQRTECIFNDLLFLSSVSYTPSHSMIIMVNYIISNVKESGRDLLNIAGFFSSN